MPGKPSRTPQPLSWKQFTVGAALKRAKQVPKRTQLVAAGLTAMPKGSGRILFIGAIGWVPELAIAGEYVAQQRDRYIEAYADYGHASGSILDGPRAKAAVHIQTPPTIHGRVLTHNGWPDLSGESRTLVFCCLAAGNVDPLLTLPARLFDKATLIGQYDQLVSLAKDRKFKVWPVAQWQDWFVVKAIVA